MTKQHPYFKDVHLANGRLFQNGEHRFLKIGKPLRHFGDQADVDQLIADLPLIASKGYDSLALNCYWHHFNPSGDGTIEASLDPLKKLIQEIRSREMFVSLSVETYGVGGGQVPKGFWDHHPDAVAMNHEGTPVRDNEFGYDSAVPSLFHPGYLEASRRYMTNLVKGLGAENFLYFETTVEPQFMGVQWLDYSNIAKSAYEAWRIAHPETDAPAFPSSFPVPETFLRNSAWNLFRAQTLAGWINGDAQALRAGSKEGARLWIATDYLDPEEETVIRRLGNAVEMLRAMSEVDIVQINWAWCNIHRSTNKKAYDRVRQVMKEENRDWVVAEHMTINGADYFENEMVGLLESSLRNGTRFGWEFVDIAPDRDDPTLRPNHVTPGDFKPQHFGVYEADWTPKPPMAVVENRWEQWMQMAKSSNLGTL